MILERELWTDKSISFLVSDIVEYDMKSAGFSIIQERNLLPENEIHEIANIEDDKREAAELAARRYYTVRSGDTLSGIAVKYGTTVTRICQLNGINRNAVLKIGKKLRVN